MTDRPNSRFRRRLLGYDIHRVEDAMVDLETQVDQLEHQLVDMREELRTTQDEGDEARHDLARARAELRYWNDRASYVDSEVARARRQAQEIEEAARQRAESVEADAQERSVQLIDRVCTEANALLGSAREEAREMFLRFETDVDMSQQKLDQLEEARRTISTTMQDALTQFADAVRRMEQVAPARLLIETSAQPQRRALPTFGRKRALEASKRFDGTRGAEADAALSSPLSAKVHAVLAPETKLEMTGAEIRVPVADEVAAEPKPAAPAKAETAASTPADTQAMPKLETSPIQPTGSSNRTHDADEEFAALLLQP